VAPALGQSLRQFGDRLAECRFTDLDLDRARGWWAEAVGADLPPNLIDPGRSGPKRELGRVAVIMFDVADVQSEDGRVILA
jgi:hypothetical protein